MGEGPCGPCKDPIQLVWQAGWGPWCRRALLQVAATSFPTAATSYWTLKTRALNTL